MPSKKFVKSLKQIENILRSETMGFLGLSADGKPYVVPLTYGYADGKILFHCALKGKKLDLIKKNPQVCFTVAKQSGKICRHPHGARCRADHDSVICYGKACIAKTMEERRTILNTFNRCLQPDTKELPLDAVSRCHAVEIKISRMTGRRQRKGLEYTYWEYSFKQ